MRNSDVGDGESEEERDVVDEIAAFIVGIFLEKRYPEMARQRERRLAQSRFDPGEESSPD